MAEVKANAGEKSTCPHGAKGAHEDRRTGTFLTEGS
jgi:hypothetical protein